MWAARDAGGVQPLFWGVTDDNRLVFGTDAAKLDGCTPTATPFPAGSLYASHDPTLCHSPGSQGWVIKARSRAGRAGACVSAVLAHSLERSVPSALPTLTHARSLSDTQTPQGEHPLPGHLLSFVASSSPTAAHRWRGIKAVPRLDAEGVRRTCL